jgi:hypothetical protein
MVSPKERFSMLIRLSSQAVPKDIHHKLDSFFQDLKAVGISYIGHGVVSNEGNHTGYFSNEEWGEFYVQNQYFFAEPILENYQQKQIDLISWEKVEGKNAIAHARNACTKIVSGMTICKKDEDFNTFFNLGFDKDVNLAEFIFLKRDLLLAYFKIFNSCHLLWRKGKGY